VLGFPTCPKELPFCSLHAFEASQGLDGSFLRQIGEAQHHINVAAE
jgi:hypothetical protein